MLNRILRLEGEVRQSPEDFELWCALADARIAVGQHDAAVEALEAAERCAAPEVSDHVRLGALVQRAGLLDRARKIFLRACQLDPEAASPQGHLGACLVALGEVAAGASCLAAASWLAPDDVGVRAALGKALVRLSRPDEARIHLEHAVHMAPSHPEAACHLAELYREDGDAVRARGVLEPAVAAHPYHRPAALSLAELLLQGGQTERAVEVLRALATHHDEDPAVLTALGRAERLAEHRASARATLTRAAALPDADSAPLVERGLLEQDAGRLPEAVDALREAVSRDPRDFAAHRALGEALHQAGDEDAALSSLARAALIAPDDPEVRDSISRIVKNSDPASDRSERATSEGRTAVAMRPSRMALSGDVHQFGMDRLLEFLSEQRRSGVLRVLSPSSAGELQIVEGSLAGATTSHSPRLGQLMMQAGLLDENTLEALVAEQHATRNPRPLGVLVVERHLLTAEQVRPVLEKQVLAALAEMMSWTDGQFAFDRQAQAALPPALGIEPEFLLEAARAERDLVKRSRTQPRRDFASTD